MQFIELFKDFVRENGLVGTLLLLFVLDKLRVYEKIKRFLRNEEEEHVHRRKEDEEVHFHQRITDDSRLLHEWVEKMKDHLEKEAKEDIMLAEMKSEQIHIREKVEDIKGLLDKFEENQKDAFKLIGQIKDHMIK